MSDADLNLRLDQLVALFDAGGIVYMVTCTAPGLDYDKKYIGLTTGPLWKREYGHYVAAETGNSADPLHSAIRKYKPPAKYFEWKVIGRADDWVSLCSLERDMIRQYRTHVSHEIGRASCRERV